MTDIRRIKLIVQIPCYNEEASLPQTIADIPRVICGVDTVEILVIDDGSTDRTVDIARESGADHVISNHRNLGLAQTFQRGLQACLTLGADIIVNTDGDNQYFGSDIERLIQPLLVGTADVVVGDRMIAASTHLPKRLKFLQIFGSWVVRTLSGVDVSDAICGFRAVSRDAAFSLNIVSKFSYTIEMLIQVGVSGMNCVSIPIRTNPKTRKSRLYKSVPEFVLRSTFILLRMYIMHRPIRFFAAVGFSIAFIGALPMFRFLYFYLFVSGSGKIQSLVLGSALMVIGLLTFIIGVVAGLLNHLRQLLELTLERVKRLEMRSFDDLAERSLAPKRVGVSTER